MKKLSLLLVILSFSFISCKVHLSKYQNQCKETGTFVFLFNKKIKYPFEIYINGEKIPVLNKEGKRLYIHNLKEGVYKILFKSDFYIFSRPVKKIKIGKDLLCYQVVLVEKYPKHFYKDKLKKQPLGKRFLNLFKFKKKEKQENIDKTKIYGVLK